MQGFYEHESVACAGPMRFSVYPAAGGARRASACRSLYYLAGLTCTEETFAIKAGAQRVAAELGLALVDAATRARARARFPGDDEPLGLRARRRLLRRRHRGALVERLPHGHATSREELPALVEAHFPVAHRSRAASSGTRWAATARSPSRCDTRIGIAASRRSRPIVAPSQVPWGRRPSAAISATDRARWAEHDATELVQRAALPGTILVDQGTRGPVSRDAAPPRALLGSLRGAGQPLELRMRDGYDHGYWFIPTFVEEHLRHHAAALL